MSNAVTGSVALTELKNDLTRLSDTLHTIYDLMNADMTQVGQAWQDGQYQQFVDGYKPQINKCEEISERYKEWCLRVLDPTIENVIAVEKTDVGGGSGYVGGANAAAGESAGAVGSTIGSGFNVTGQPTQGKIHYNHYSQVEKWMGIPRDAEEKCIDAHGRKWSPVSDDVAKKYSSSFEVRDTPQEKEIHGGSFGGTVEGKIGASVPLEGISANAQVGTSANIGWENKSEKNWDSIHCMNQDDIDKINKMNGQ
jgi:hypothetical protein